ncbi:MAG: RNA polymerase sigma factor [Myxococcota bacterium]|jgi:RNA polymerase sigma-70 factor (ECF subfamily)|nr:RNA polymerase sigma factor [Myxococcota bacterium]
MMWTFLFALGLLLRPTAKLSPEALGALYRDKGSLVLRRALILLRDRAAAEDVLQEVFVRVMRYGAPVGQTGVPLSFLYRTTERCCFDRLRRRNRELPTDKLEGIDIGLVQKDCGAMSEAGEIVLRFFGTLPDKLQQVALLHYVDGLTQERIAQELDWSRRTVGKKLVELEERAVRLAKRCAEEKGVPISLVKRGLSTGTHESEEP